MNSSEYQLRKTLVRAAGVGHAGPRRENLKFSSLLNRCIKIGKTMDREAQRWTYSEVKISSTGIKFRNILLHVYDVGHTPRRISQAPPKKAYSLKKAEQNRVVWV